MLGMLLKREGAKTRRHREEEMVLLLDLHATLHGFVPCWAVRV
jgi:hypothetical protein